MSRSLSLLFAALFLAILVALPAAAADHHYDIQGWEKGGAYDSHYDVKKYEKIKGTLLEIKTVTPLEGMAPGLAIIIEPKKGGEPIVIHAGPRDFVKFIPYAFADGDYVQAKGVFATINGQRVFMASKIRNNEIYEFKMRRTSDGTPYWTLSRDELTQEKLEQ